MPVPALITHIISFAHSAFCCSWKQGIFKSNTFFFHKFPQLKGDNLYTKIIQKKVQVTVLIQEQKTIVPLNLVH